MKMLILRGNDFKHHECKSKCDLILYKNEETKYYYISYTAGGDVFRSKKTKEVVDFILNEFNIN